MCCPAKKQKASAQGWYHHRYTRRFHNKVHPGVVSYFSVFCVFSPFEKNGVHLHPLLHRSYSFAWVRCSVFGVHCFRDCTYPTRMFPRLVFLSDFVMLCVMGTNGTILLWAGVAAAGSCGRGNCQTHGLSVAERVGYRSHAHHRDYYHQASSQAGAHSHERARQ